MATLSSTTVKLVDAAAVGVAVGIAGTARPLDLPGTALGATFILDVVVAVVVGVVAVFVCTAEEADELVTFVDVGLGALPGVRGGGARLGARLNESCAPGFVAIATGATDKVGAATAGRGALVLGGAAAGVGESELGRCQVVSLVTA